MHAHRSAKPTAQSCLTLARGSAHRNIQLPVNERSRAQDSNDAPLKTALLISQPLRLPSANLGPCCSVFIGHSSPFTLIYSSSTKNRHLVPVVLFGVCPNAAYLTPSEMLACCHPLQIHPRQQRQYFERSATKHRLDRRVGNLSFPKVDPGAHPT